MTLAKRIIPCLDVDRGRVVKGVQFLDIRDVDTFLKRPTAPPELSKKGGKLYNA